VLLQRSRGITVARVYRELFRRWPDAEHLSRARESTITAVIRPLGLVRRAATLKALAREVVDISGVPNTIEALLELPGVGRYAAGATLANPGGFIPIALKDISQTNPSSAQYIVEWIFFSIVILLLSAITWVPGLMLFVLQSSLEGWSWFTQNIWIASAIFIGSLVWILLLALLTQAISAWVKWRVASRAALLAAFFIPSAFASIVNEIFRTRWGHIFDLQALIGNIWAGLFGRFQQQYGYVDRSGVEHLENAFTEPPLWASWLVMFLICAACLWLLSRKVKAYEVVK